MRLFEELAKWVGAWPLWLQILLTVTVGPVMVLHFLFWVRSLIVRWANWQAEQDATNVTLLRRRGDR